MNKLKKGLTYISERTDQLRYSDKNKNEKWLQPLSEYIPLERIMRGQPVSIATAKDIADAEKRLELPTGSLENDSNTYIVLTNPLEHTHTVGLAYEFCEGPTVEDKSVTLPDPIHILGQGRFEINLDYLIKSHQEEKLDDVINKTEYVPDFLYNYENNIGKPIWVKGNEPGKLTIIDEEAYQGYRNIIQIGFISDAWLLDGVKNTPEKDSVSIEVQIEGDNRGPLDSTQFEGILGEDVVIPSNDPVRVFAFGQEEDKCFEGRLNITPSTISNFDTKTAFIGVQKMDGKTAVIKFGDDFDFSLVQTSAVTEDNAFANIAGLYNDALGTTTKVVSATYNVYKTDLRRTVKEAQESIVKALKEAFEYASDGLTIETEVMPDSDEVSAGYIKYKATQPGGYIFVYVSSELQSFFKNSVVFCNGSLDNRGKVVLADSRIKERQNLIGVYFSGKTDQLLKKDSKCIFLHDGLFVHNTDRYQANGENYYLFHNGKVSRYQDPGAYSINHVLTVQDNHKLIVHCDPARERIDQGNLPVGYMKPAIYGENQFFAEFGFLLMDGKTRHKVSQYPMLVERLKAWYPETSLHIGIFEDEEEECFTIPECCTATSDSDNNVMQIKASDVGTYIQEKDLPYIRKFGNFEKDDKECTIDTHKKGVAYPQIGRYKKTVETKDGPVEEEIDTRMDISSLCSLCIRDNKVAVPSIDLFEAHLYVDPEYPHKDNLIHWVEVRNGFHNYNNILTYGFEWKIEQIEGRNKNNEFGTYLLSTDIKDGMGIYYQRSANQAPTPLSGKPWKVVIAKRPEAYKQFDLGGLIDSYISDSALNFKGVPDTEKAVTGAGVIEAIENRFMVRKLKAYSGEEDGAEISLGSEYEPAKKVELSSYGEMPIYSGQGIKFENTLKDGLKEDVKIYLENNRFVMKKGHDDQGHAIDVPTFDDMKPNELVTKGQVKEHIDTDAFETTINNKDEKPVVHGMLFGLGGNIDASLFNGLKLAVHHEKQIGNAEGDTHEVQGDGNENSYIPYVYYSSDPLGYDNAHTGSNFVYSNEGYTVHLSRKIGEGSEGVFSEELYKEENGNIIDHNELINSKYDAFTDSKTKYNSDDVRVQYKTYYNFYTGEAPEVEDEENNEFTKNADIVFAKTTIDKKGERKDGLASIRAGAVYSGSLAKYKDIYGESINKYPDKHDDLYNVNYREDTNAFGYNKEFPEYVGSALQALYEMPLAFFHYKSEPEWYKRYLGIIVDRVNDMKEKINGEMDRHIFTEEERNWDIVVDGETIHPTKDFSEVDNKYHYSEDELASIKTYFNAITDSGESAQNILSSVGMLIKAAKETQARMLKLEASTFGSDASTIPGHKERINFPNTPDVNPEATHLGLNRLVRAMSRELYGTSNPADSQIEESNDTSSTLSRVDELEMELEGATFDKNVKTDSSDNGLSEVAATYPYKVAETAHGGHTDYSAEPIDKYIPITEGKYISCITGKETDAPEDVYLKFSSEDRYILKSEAEEEGHDQLTFDGIEYAKETLQPDSNWDPITGRLPKEGETENASIHGTWTKVDLEKDQKFISEGDSFKAGTENNLVPEKTNRDKFNGVIDAIARICTKVNALTYTVNGVDNIDSTPRRLNTIRQNIETLIKEAYFDGAPETTVTPATDEEIASASTEERIVSKEYIDEDVNKPSEDVPQPSTPYNEKKATEEYGKDYTGISRFDQLSKDLYDYVIAESKDQEDLFYNVNSNNMGQDIKEKDHVAIQYTSEDDVNERGASKTQVLTGRTFNGKKLLIDGVKDNSGADVNQFNQTHPDNCEVTSVHINVPDSIEEYQYASIIDILIDAIGPAYFRKQLNVAFDKDQDQRSSRTLTTRIENIEKALDNVVLKLSHRTSFETDTTKVGNKVNSESDTIVYSVEDYMETLNKWFGLKVPTESTDNDKWDKSATAEVACGYGKGDRPDGTSEDGLADANYLDSPNPIVNSNFVIKQLLKRVRGSESDLAYLQALLGDEYNEGIVDTKPETDENGTTTYHPVADYNLSDDVKDLLLTIYGMDKDSPETVQNNTQFTHRSLVADPKFITLFAWEDKNETHSGVIYTKKGVPSEGDTAYKTAALKEEFGIVTKADAGQIVVNNIAFTRDSEDDFNESSLNTRFSGNASDRNIIDDIVKEMYYVPATVDTKLGYTAIDTKDVDYKDQFYKLDAEDGESGDIKHVYDYGKKYSDPYGSVGNAIGYGNRNTLFRDYKGKEKPYRRSRFEVLENEIRNLRSILGLNLINDGKNIDPNAAETAYGGKFMMKDRYNLGGHDFHSEATRNGNLYTKDGQGELNQTTESSLLTVLFNMENAIMDISRELGKETFYNRKMKDNRDHDFEKGEQLNNERELSIYDRLNDLEDITGKLLGIENNENEDGDDIEDDTSGILDIQWIEE